MVICAAKGPIGRVFVGSMGDTVGHHELVRDGVAVSAFSAVKCERR